MNPSIVLFDGVCNFCSFWVKFASQRNNKNNLRFASLQSNAGIHLLKKYNIRQTNLSTVVFIDKGKVFTQSSAAFNICKHLDGFWRIGYALLIIPKPIRDFFYNIIAKNRYRWFGKTDDCYLPTDELKERFIE